MDSIALMSNRFIKKGISLLTVFMLYALTAHATPVISNVAFTTTNCKAGGTITVTVTGATGSVYYGLQGPVSFGQQATNTFTGLTSGTYTVQVWDATTGATPVTQTKVVTNNYTDPTVSSANGTYNGGAFCGPKGIVNVTVSGGQAPYSFQLMDAAGTTPIGSPQGATYTNGNYTSFTGLVNGTYTVRITDNCGTSFITGPQVVSSPYTDASKVATLTLNSINGYPYYFYLKAGSCDSMNVYLYPWWFNYTAKDAGGATLTPLVYDLEARVEVPANSGKWTNWTQLYSTTNNIAFPNTGASFDVNFQLRNPCTGVTSGVVSYTYAAATINTSWQNNGAATMCNPVYYLNISGSNMISYCAPYDVKVIDVSASNTTVYDSVFTSNATSFSLTKFTNNLTVSSHTYKVQITDGKGQTITSNSFSPPNIPRESLSVSFSNTTDAVSCDFTSSRMSFSSGNGNLQNGPYPITYTVLSGPSTGAAAAGTVVTVNNANQRNPDNTYAYQYPFGTAYNVAYGNYKIEVAFGGSPACRKDTLNKNVSQVYNAAKITGNLTYSAGTNGCGYYNVYDTVNFINATTGTKVAGYYYWYLYKGSGTSITYYTSGWIYGTAPWSYNNIPSGTYTFKIYPYSASTAPCNGKAWDSLTFVLPDYKLPLVNTATSGGLVCIGQTTGSLLVDATGFGTLQYKYKVKGASDATYSSFQTSNTFTGLTPGVYTVMIQDGCGGQITQDITLVSAAAGSSLNVSGATNNKVCSGSSASLSITPIGTVTNIVWTTPTGTQSGASLTSITIPSFGAADAGNYKATITSAQGCSVDATATLALGTTPTLVVNNPAGVCTGSTVDLSAAAVTAGSTNVASYKYYSDAAGTTLLPSPVVTASVGTTAYFIQAISADGCSVMKSVTVTGNALPTASISYSGTPYCATGTASVTQTGTIGGTYSSSAGLSINASTGAINLASSTPGTYTVTYSFTNGTCSNTTTTSVTINALPTASISYSGTPYCAAGTASVTQTGTTGGTYSSTAGLSINASTGAINLVTSTPGTYTVTYSFSNGTCSNTTTTSVTINALPTASISYSGTPYCATGTASVTQTGQTGGTYSSTAGLSINASTGVINLASSTPGTYTVTYSFSNGTCSNTTTTSVKINALPTAPNTPTGNTQLCPAGPLNISTTTTGSSYQWYQDGVPISGATANSYDKMHVVTTDAGNYTVTVTDANGCTSAQSAAITIVITSLPIANIYYAGSPYCATGTASVILSGLTGGTYSSWTGLSINASTGAIDLAASTPGTYVVSYLYSNNANCYETATSDVTINALPTASISYSGTPYCATGTASVTQTGQPGGTYSSTAGLSINAGTGAINLASSTPGTYTVTYSFSNGTCSNTTTTTVVINSSATAGNITANGTTICSGTTASLSATASGVTSPVFNWYADNTGSTVLSTGANYTTPSLSATTTYYVGVSGTGLCENTPATRKAVVVTVNPNGTAANITASGTTICSGTTASLSATASGVTSPVFNWYADNTGSTVLSTGANYTTPSLSATTTYYVGVSGTGLCENTPATRKAVVVTVNPNGTAANITASGTTICSGTTASLSATASGVTSPVFNWYADNTGSTVLSTGANYTTSSLSATTTYYVGVSGTGLCENTPATRKAVIVTVTPRAAATDITANGTTICSGTTASLSATASGVTSPVFNWYADNTGSTVLSTGANYTTSSLSATTTYYVGVSGTGLCENTPATRKAVIVTVTPRAGSTDITANGTTICSGTTASLSATASGVTSPVFNWYADNTGSTVLSTGANYTTSSLSTTTTYYVGVSGTGLCENTPATRKAVIVTVTPRAGSTDITASGTTICSGTTASLSATASGVTSPVFNWYADNTGSTVLSTGANYTTPSLSATTTYYVGVSGTGLCENTPATRKAVVVTVNPNGTAANITASGTTICSGTTASLSATASGVTSPVFNWYADNTGSTVLSTGANYTTPSLSATTTYYVGVSGTGLCENTPATRKAVVVTVNPNGTAANITASGTTICSGTTASLSATASGVTSPVFNWYADNTGSTVLSTGANYTTPSLSATTTYYVGVSGTGLCENTPATRKAVVVTVNPNGTAANITASGTTICSGTTASLSATASGVTSPVFNWYADNTGSTVLSIGANYTTPSLSATTTYYVGVSGTGLCENTPATREAVIVTVTPRAGSTDITASGTTICSGTTASLSATASGVTSPVFNWYADNTGSTVLSTGANYTTSSLSATTTYYVGVSGTGLCENTPATRKAVIVTVTPRAAATDITANGTTICSGTTASLSATASGVTSPVFNWYADNTGSTVLSTGANYTTSSLSAITTYYVGVSGTGLCENTPATRKAVIVTVTPRAAATDITASGTTICSGTTASLSTIASGVTSPVFNWYADNTGSTVLSTGANYTTPSLSATTAYYVGVSGTGLCENTPATREAVIVTVTPRAGSTDITASGTTICSGTTASLSATASGVTSPVFNWYADNTGSTVLSTGANYTTPSLSATTTYYVGVSGTGLCENTPATRKAVIVTVTPRTGSTDITASGTTICSGTTASLSATASGVTSPVFNWYADNTGSTVLSTGANYTTPSLSSTTTYYVGVSGTGLCENTPATRTAVTVTVNPLPNVPAITSNLALSDIGLNKTVTLTATSTGTPVPTAYQWYKNGAAISGAVNNTYTINSFQPGDIAAYTVTAAVSATTCTSSASAAINLDIKAFAKLQLAKTVDRSNVKVGENVVFTITASNIGNNDTTGVQIVDMPTGFTYVSDNGGGSFNSSTMTWTAGALAVNESKSIAITMKAIVSGAYKNIAVGNDPTNPTNPSDTAKFVMLDIKKTASSSNVKVGENVVFTISVTNRGTKDTTGVQIVDMPTGFTYVSDNGGGSFNSSTLTWTAGALAVNASKSIDITMKTIASGTYNNVAVGNDPTNPTNPSDTAKFVMLDIKKTASTSNVKVGENVVFTINVTNRGTKDTTGVQIVDMPTGFTYVSDNGGGSFNSSTMTWTAGTVAVNASKSIAITMKTIASGTYNNVAVGNDPTNPTNPSDTAKFVMLDIKKTASTSNVKVGENVVFTINVTNRGTKDTTGVQIVDMPTGFTYVSDNGGGSFNSSTMTWTAGTVAANASKSIDITMKAIVSGAYKNIAVGNDPTNPTNPSDTAKFVMLDLKKTADRSNVKKGDNVVFTLSVINRGTKDTTGVVITDIPEGFTYVSDNSGGVNGTYNSSTGKWTVDVPQNIIRSINVTMKADASGEYSNIIVGGDGKPDNPVNPVDTAKFTSIIAVKSVKDANNNGKAEAGEELTYTITIHNTGTASATNVVISDPIPANTAYVPGSGGILAGNTVSFVTNLLLPDESRSYSFKVKVTDDLTGVTTVANTATVSVNGGSVVPTEKEDPNNPGMPDPSCTDPSGCPTNIPTNGISSFVALKSVADANQDGKAEAGEELTYTIKVVNTGSVRLDNITVSDNVPAHTTYVAGSGGTLNGNAVSFTGVNLAVHATATYSFKVKVADDIAGIGATIANVATVIVDTIPSKPTKPVDPNNPDQPDPACTNPAGCPTVLPVDDNIIGVKPVCVNSTITLANAVSGGIWNSNNTAVAQINPLTGIVTGISAGTANISYTVNGKTVQADITVNPLPVVPAITGNTDICINSGGTLSNAVANGVWSSDNTAIVTIDAATGLMTSVSAGSGVIKYTVTNANTKCQTTVQTNITVYPMPVMPAITGATQVCEQSAIILGNTASGGVWSSSDAAIATVDNNGKVTGISNGDAVISYTVTNKGGCATTVKATVTVNKKPVIITTTIAPVCAPNTIDLRTGISNYDANNYAYVFTDATGVIVTNPAAVSVTGSYNVAAQNKASGCSADVQTLQVVVNPKPVVNMVTLTPGEVCAPATVNIQSLITNYNTTKYVYSYTDQYGNDVTVPTAINTSGNYMIKATDGNTHCSSDPVTVAVKVNAQPVVTVINNGNMALCGNTGTVDLKAGITNFNTANYNYAFTDAGGNPLGNVSAIGIPGTYYVTARDANTNCPSVKTSITLTRYDLPTLTVTDPASVYDPYTVDITAPAITAGSTSGQAFTYYDNNNQVLSNTAAQKISGPGNYTYYIQGTTTQGCKSNIAPVHVLIKDRPVLSISSAEIMEGQSATLTVSLPAGVTIPDAIKVVLTEDRTASTIRVGDYTMPATVTIPANTNAATFSVNTWDNNVLDLDRLLVVIGSNSTYRITNGTVLIHDTTSLKPQNMVITIDRDTIYGRGTGVVSVHLPTGISTSYPITVNVYQAGGSTINSSDYTMPGTVTIPSGTSSALLQITVATSAQEDRVLNLRGESTGFTVKDGGLYIRKSRINVVPLVSDNNDGINDYLKIEGIDKYLSKMGGSNKVTLFNRWEDVIYEAENYDNAAIKFDGRGNKHGAGRVPDGVYFYVITITIPDNDLGVGEQKTQTFKGYFRLQK